MMMYSKAWNDRADKDLFFTILSVKNIGIISGTEWTAIGNHMRTMGYGFTNEGCRQHFQGLRRAQSQVEQAAAAPFVPARRLDPTLNPITRRPGPGRPKKQKAPDGSSAQPKPVMGPPAAAQPLPLNGHQMSPYAPVATVPPGEHHGQQYLSPPSGAAHSSGARPDPFQEQQPVSAGPARPDSQANDHTGAANAANHVAHDANSEAVDSESVQSDKRDAELEADGQRPSKRTRTETPVADGDQDADAEEADDPDMNEDEDTALAHALTAHTDHSPVPSYGDEFAYEEE